MDPTFKPRRIGMLLIEERYPCGRHSKGRNRVYYKCRCDCGKEFVLTGDELIKNPYSCGCTPKPKEPIGERKNDWALGYDKESHTMQCMMKPTRHVYLSSKSGISGVYYIKNRDKWRAVITYKQHTYHLGMFKTKEEAIRARVRAIARKGKCC